MPCTVLCTTEEAGVHRGTSLHPGKGVSPGRGGYGEPRKAPPSLLSSARLLPTGHESPGIPRCALPASATASVLSCNHCSEAGGGPWGPLAGEDGGTGGRALGTVTQAGDRALTLPVRTWSRGVSAQPPHTSTPILRTDPCLTRTRGGRAPTAGCRRTSSPQAAAAAPS